MSKQEERSWTVIAGTSVRVAGRTRVDASCPFCTSQLTLYVWSFSGHGKKTCRCGAVLYRGGVARKLSEQVQP